MQLGRGWVFIDVLWWLIPSEGSQEEKLWVIEERSPFSPSSGVDYLVAMCNSLYLSFSNCHHYQILTE